MPTPDFDDHSHFFADWGIPITLNLFGSNVPITALFSDETGHFFTLESLNRAVNPFVLVKSSDVTSLEEKNDITINGDKYNILAIDPDGQGMTMITLKKEPDAC